MQETRSPATAQPQPEMRIDKWLKVVRIFKRREDAADACQLGRVKLNGQVAKASRTVTAGDAIVVRMGNHYRELEVLLIPTRGLSAKDAKTAYKDNSPEIPKETKELMKLQREFERKNPRRYKGRPTKKERRDWLKKRGL